MPLGCRALKNGKHEEAKRRRSVMTKAKICDTARLIAAVGALVLGVGTLLAAAGDRRGEVLRQVGGDPNLMGVWEAPKLGVQAGQDQFSLTKLETLYRPNVRKSVSPQDDPALHCSPSAFPRAATYGWPIQIVQHPGFVYIYSEAF